VKNAIYQNFILAKQPVIYDPQIFAEFCCQAGFPNIINHILQDVSDDRHSKKRQDLNHI
jgi:hypothetical protein